MKHEYQTTGVCAKSITFDMDESQVISNISFEGGCNGNLKGVCALADGKTADELVGMLKGITCGKRATSCPDQLAIAITQNLG